MQVLGLLGGVSSGKSLVAHHLAALGAVVFDADQAAHEALRDPDVEVAIRARWGDGVFDAGGRVDRAAVAEIVFSPSEEGPGDRRFLEALVHPRVERRFRKELKQLAAARRPAAVLDAALLLEVGWDRLCNVLIFVDSPRALRAERARARGWDARELALREAVQWPLEQKRQRADFVIDNSGSITETRAQVERLWRDLAG